MNRKEIKKNIKQEEQQICYFIYGDPKAEKTIVFLNGFFNAKELWVKQQRDKSLKQYRLIFLDYRGFGGSNIPYGEQYKLDDLLSDVHSVVQNEQLKKVSLCAYSAGGVIAIAFAKSYPSLIDKLILLNSGTVLSPLMRTLLEHMTKLLRKGVNINDVFPFIHPWFFSEKFIDKILYDARFYIKENFNPNGPHPSLFFIDAVFNNAPALTNTLRNLQAPVLFVSSAQDKIFRLGDNIEFIIGNKNITFFEVANCGHALFVEKGKEVNVLLKEFLEQ